MTEALNTKSVDQKKQVKIALGYLLYPIGFGLF